MFQLIEEKLQLIYATLQRTEESFSLLYNYEAVEKYSLSQIILALRSEEKKGNSVLSDEDYEILDKIRERRNYWCHQCYRELPYDNRTGELKYPNRVFGMKKELADYEYFYYDRLGQIT